MRQATFRTSAVAYKLMEHYREKGLLIERKKVVRGTGFE